MIGTRRRRRQRRDHNKKQLSFHSWVCVFVSKLRGARCCDCSATQTHNTKSKYMGRLFNLCARRVECVDNEMREHQAAACAHGRATITRDNYIIARSLLKRSNPTLRRGLITSLYILCALWRDAHTAALANWRKITRTLTWQHTHLLHSTFSGAHKKFNIFNAGK